MLIRCLGTNILKSISDQYAVKIEILRFSQIIRIVGSQQVCGDIYRLLKFVNSNMKTEKTFFDVTDPYVLDSSTRDQIAHDVSRSTGTLIKFKKSTRQSKTALRHTVGTISFLTL